MSIEIKILTDLKDPAINNYYNKFHNDNRTNEAFNWEFCQTPSSPSIYIHAFEENNEIIGAISVLFFEMINGAGGKILTGKPEDVMVDIFSSIKHRKIDILKKLYETLEKECIRRNVILLWGFTYADTSFKRLGFQSTFTSNNGVFVLNPIKSYNYLATLNKENELTDLLKIYILAWISYFNRLRIWFSSSKVNGNLVIDDIGDHEDLIFRHLEYKAEFYTLNQDKEYINWRLNNNPYNIKYKSIALRNHDQAKLAEVIYSLHEEVAYLEQIIYDKSLNDKQVVRFLKRAISIVSKNNISIIRFMGFRINIYNKMEIRFLKRLGFVFTKKGIPFIFKKLSDNLGSLNSKDLFISRLYTQGNL